MSSKSEINPILLEKSDDLIKAEIQLQRQRLERALREQIEQQKLAAKALLQTSESLPNFDLSEVLSKALAIVHPSINADAESSADAPARPPSSTSDSFDENTFYSSQLDTPEGSTSSRGQKESVILQSHSALLDGERVAESSAQSQEKDREVVMTGTSLSHDNDLATLGHLQPQHLQQHPSSSTLRDKRLDHKNSGSGSNPTSMPTPSPTEVQRLGKVSFLHVFQFILLVRTT
jgi:hypothetical protein